MYIWVESRTKTEDYTWRTCTRYSQSAPPKSVTEGFDQWKFEDGIPWFGLVSCQGVATLFFGNLMANREDSHNRPIFVHAALQAESDKDVRDLHGIAASLLVHEKELLPIWTAYLLGVFDGEVARQIPLPSQYANISATQESIGRYVYPREDATSREHIARMLCSVESFNFPLVVGTTGRSGKGLFERVCKSKGEWQIAFFSSSCSAKTELLPVVVVPLPGGGPNTRVTAAAIGGVILLSALLVAAGRSCRNGGGSREAIASTNQVSRASGKGVVATNAPSSSGISATNALPLDGGNRESVVETWRDDSPASSTPAETETTETALKPLYPQTSNKPTKENQP